MCIYIIIVVILIIFIFFWLFNKTEFFSGTYSTILEPINPFSYKKLNPMLNIPLPPASELSETGGRYQYMAGIP